MNGGRAASLAAAGLPAAALLAAIAIGGTAFARLAVSPPPEVELAAYATSLGGRSRAQRHNAWLAARSIDGRVVAPGATFSFNRAVRSWSADQGYVKAPVSYDGYLVRAFGGGVCQTSTTLYNAALLAGLTIVERHHHVFVPHYVAAGRDAAVAYPTIDLRFRNPYPWAVRLRASADAGHLVVRVLGRKRVGAGIEITSEVLSVSYPSRLTRRTAEAPMGGPAGYLRCPGKPGYRVVTWRCFRPAGASHARREWLSDDTYPALNRVVQVSDDEALVAGGR